MKKNRQNYSTGFTLVELIVTIAVVGIFASIALPSFARLIESNRINTGTNELVSALLLTRSEALKRSNTVTFCPSITQNNTHPSCSGVSNYSKGWIIFLDCDGDGQVDSGVDTDGCEENILKVREGFDGISVSNATVQIRFGFSGRPDGGDNSTFTVADSNGNARKQVVVSLVGRVRSQNAP